MNDHESTPLLRPNANDTTPSASELRLTPIAPTARRVATLQADQIRYQDIVNHEGLHFENHPTQVAFALAVLLHLRKNSAKPSSADGPYEFWLSREVAARDADILEKQLADIWTLFLAEYRSARDIQTVLWSRFPLDDGLSQTCRVVDFLVDCDSPVSLTSHPLVTSSFGHAWEHGVSLELTSPNTSAWLIRYDALSTPRVVHFIDWTSHLIFLALLAHYLLYPIEQPHASDKWLPCQYGAREIFLILLPLSFAAQSWSLANTSSLLVSFAFLASLPSAPIPASFTFTLLQWAAVLQPLGLNLPQTPSHLFLLQRSFSLPLAVLISQGLSRILYPVILFFLPLLLLATYLLSLSLVDTFLTIPSTQTFFMMTTATPTETRFGFLWFFCIVIILLLTSIFVLATTTSSAPTSSDPWDRYSKVVGHVARRVFARATVSYIGPYTFPAPFNLVHIAFIRVPQVVAHIFAIQTPSLNAAERILWRILIGPFTVFVSFFFWRPTRSFSYPRSQST